MIRVLLAEDSATLRELLCSVLSADPDIEIVGVASNGAEAIRLTGELRPDVIAMDVEMPGLDGFEATKEIMIEMPTPIVIISGNLDIRQVGVSIAALNAGALAVLAKPSAVGAAGFAAAADELVRTIKAMAGMKLVRQRRHRPPVGARADSVPSAPPLRAIAVAASTGGPAALRNVLSALPADFPVPILVVQHMTPGFVQGLADWLSTVCALRVSVARHGELPQASSVYLAADDHHLTVGPDQRLRFDDGPPVFGFRPSATRLFESVGAIYGRRSLAVMLTGMGQDGVDGLRPLRKAGGRVLGQDEASSVVFGMPRAAIESGLVDTVLPLERIGAYLRDAVASF